jgi:hypothetical protein
MKLLEILLRIILPLIGIVMICGTCFWIYTIASLVINLI